MALSIVSLLLGTVWGGVDYPWGSWQIIGLFATAVIGGVLFVWRETKAKEPILPLRLFKSFHDVFLIGIPFAFAAFITSLFLKETPLRSSNHGTPAPPTE